MQEQSTSGAGAAVEAAAAGREDQRGVAELGFAAGGRAAPEGVTGRGEVPDPELVEQAKRRSFTAEYKARILAEADACTRPVAERSMSSKQERRGRAVPRTDLAVLDQRLPLSLASRSGRLLVASLGPCSSIAST